MIERYVAGIDFSRDRIFGVFALDRTLIGMAHLALDPTQWFAEIGLSVEPAYRDQGCGHALLQRAILHAANSGYRTLFMHCLAENAIMKHLARKSGLKVVVAHGEANAHLALSRQLHGVQPAKVFDGQAALIDSLFKQHLASSIEARTTAVHPEPTSGSTSPAPHSHAENALARPARESEAHEGQDAIADRAPIKTPSRGGGFFERLDRWCAAQQRRETEAYLAKATDVYDLELRIRALERKGPHQSYR